MIFHIISRFSWVEGGKQAINAGLCQQGSCPTLHPHRRSLARHRRRIVTLYCSDGKSLALAWHTQPLLHAMANQVGSNQSSPDSQPARVPMSCEPTKFYPIPIPVVGSWGAYCKPLTKLSSIIPYRGVWRGWRPVRLRVFFVAHERRAVFFSTLFLLGTS